MTPVAPLFTPKLEVDELTYLFSEYGDIRDFAEGGQGCIFKAVSDSGIPVAIKIYAPDQTIVRAELEVQKLQHIRSHYMVQLIKSGYVNIRGKESFYTVTRFEEGEDLRRHLSNQGNLCDAEVRLLLAHICTAIDELWAAKVVHCDIKPENILQGADGNFRLVDLGLAKHLDAKTITQFGMTMGTIGYMAPEQMAGRKNYTLRVDLFALGVVAYEALTGVHPFGKNQMLIASPKIPIQLPSELVKVDTDLEETIVKMLNRNPLLRPKSGSSVIAMIGG